MSWPTWPLTRIFGLVSYLALFVGISLGMIYSWPLVKPSWKKDIYMLHRFFANAGVLLALSHASVLVVDTYLPFRWREVLVPFASESHPVLNGIGTLSLYGVLLLILTSDLRPLLKRKLWFAVHLLSYPLFLLAIVHGFFIGTDSALPAVKFMYGGTLGFTVLLVALRSPLRARGRMRVNRPGSLSR